MPNSELTFVLIDPIDPVRAMDALAKVLAGTGATVERGGNNEGHDSSGAVRDGDRCDVH